MSTRQYPVSFIAAASVLVLAIMFYDVMGAIIKHLGAQYPATQLSMFRSLFGLIPTLFILLRSRDWVSSGKPIRIRQWKLALMRGGIAALAQICFYTSLFYLELATATAILFSGPLFITALSIPLLGNHIGFWRWLAVLTGFCGVMLIIDPTSLKFTWYAILPLCAAFGYSCISVTSRLFDKNVPTALLNLYSLTGSLIGSTLLVVFTGGYVHIGSPQDWAWVAMMGVAGGTAALLLVSAYRMAEPGSLSPFEYFGIPFSFFLGWVFFAEAPFDRLIPGVFLIVGGGLLVVWRERSLKKPKS